MDIYLSDEQVKETIIQDKDFSLLKKLENDDIKDFDNLFVKWLRVTFHMWDTNNPHSSHENSRSSKYPIRRSLRIAKELYNGK